MKLIYPLSLTFLYLNQLMEPLVLLISVYISSILHSLPNLLIFGLFTDVIAKQYLDLYITVSYNHFGNLKFVSYLTLWLYF